METPEKKEVLSVRLPKEYKDYLLLYCEEHEITMTELIQQILEVFILE